jgi:hypothetical protein
MRPLEPGTVVAGYRIESLVGRGGMGVVYRALQVGLERIVALKVIAPELVDEEDIRRRFLAEARAAASVDHPNVIPVHEAGEDDGIAFIAMRFVAGSDLRSLVRRGGALDPAEAAGYVAQASAALDAIHRAGFVHRDVKPANLLVDPGGHVYVTDFGLAKQVLTGAGGTRTGQWVGTLDYVAPEQIRGGRVDARADVYALGGVLHFALTGRVPFEREGDEAKLWAQLSAPPPVPSALRRGLRGEFDGVVGRAMAKDAAERHLSAGDLGRAALAAAAGTMPTEPERVVARGAAAPGAAPTEPGLAAEASTRTAHAGPVPEASLEFVPRVARRRRSSLLAVGAAGLVLVAVLAALLFRPDEPAPSARATPQATRTGAPPPTAAVSSRAPTITTTKGVGNRPNGIALANGDLWVTSAGSAFLTRVSATTMRERGRHIKVGFDARAIVAYRDSIWVAVTSTREVLRIDARTGAVRARLRIAAKPIRLAVAGSGVWVGTDWQQGGAGQLLRYDRRTGALLQTIVVNEGVGGVMAAAGAIWVVKSRSAKVARLEPGASVLADWAALPGAAETMRYGAGSLWVTYAGDAIARIAIRTGAMVTTSAGHGPAQVTVAGGRVFVASRNDQAVLMLDPVELAPVGEPIRVGLNPYAMVADERYVWVTGLGDNTLTRIDYR